MPQAVATGECNPLVPDRAVLTGSPSKIATAGDTPPRGERLAVVI
jgi:hypothetical protein